MKRTYSQQEREAALVVCVESGVYRAARQTGIPRTTIDRWRRQAGIGTDHVEKVKSATEAREARIAEMRASLKHRLLEEAHYCLDAIHNEHIDFKSGGPAGPFEVRFPVAPAAAVQHYATSLGILIDKFRLESGEATSREEVVTVDAVDKAIADLERELALRPSIDARTAEAN
jgi:transposase-like protein